MPLIETKGAASAQGFGLTLGGAVPNYIEDVFSTYLYTGTGAAQTITNGIDLAGKGGLVWIKARSVAEFNVLVDSARGPSKALRSSSTAAEINDAGRVSAFTSSGFTIGADGEVSGNGNTHVSWTFREQKKFFTTVTYTGTGTASQTISHNLGSRPGCIIIKRTDSTSDWFVGHDYDVNKVLYLNSDLGATNITWNGWVFDPTTFRTPSISGSPDVNVSGATYVAYLFASNAGGFGLTGTDSVIRCGSFSPDSYNYLVTNIGWEPQWLLVKKANAGSDWFLLDTMRGFTVNSVNDAVLKPNTSFAEESFNLGSPESTGFGFEAGDTGTYIYIAIRRPMKVPTDGTKVFKPAIRTGTGTTTTVTGVGFPLDVVITNTRNYPGFAGHIGQFWDRLRGAGRFLRTPFTNAEGAVANAGVLGQDGYTVSNSSGGQNGNGEPFVDYSFRRAPGFFDICCYSGTGADRTVAHNLTVAPELMIIKRRNTTGDWWVVNVAGSQQLNLNQNYEAAALTTTLVPSAPTSTTFSVGTYSQVNGSGSTFVAYLFATCPGVSKVGSYTGNSDVQTINCGFTSGARFVLIKRTDVAEDWFVFDTARGINAGDDKILSLNTTAAEVTNRNNVSPASVGFEVNNDGGFCNASGGTYIFLAIA